MKKILAIAVASAIAAPAMADMTIGGTIAAGYSASSADYVVAAALPTTAGSTTVTAPAAATGNAGFGIDTAQIVISGSTTTDSGLTVAGYMTSKNLTRTAGAAGGNAELSVAGDFGKVYIKNVLAGDGTLGYAAATGTEEFSAELASESSKDYIGYTGAFGAVSVNVEFADAGNVGNGQDTAFSPSVNVTYNGEGYSVFAKTVAYASDDTADSFYRVGGKTTMGDISVAAAFSSVDVKAAGTTAAYTTDESAVGASYKVNDALTLGATYARVDKSTSTVGVRKGTSVGATYALNANASVNVKMASWDDASGVSQDSSAALLTLSF